jgi:myo-inositol-1(or 4)-monophosphatase
MYSNYDLQTLTSVAGEAVREAAAFIRGEAGRVEPGQIEEKHLNGLVSYVDRTAEEMLVERLGRLLPEAGYITEEGTVEAREADLKWIIDPLDGTTNFLHGVPHYSISVALQKGGELVLGIVHHVPLDEHYTAWAGGGAWCNGERIAVSTRTPLRQALVVTGFPYHNFSRADGWFHALRSFLQGARALRRYGSAALDLAYVARGRFEIFYEYGLNSYDVAAGTLLVREAGGQAVDFSGGANCVHGGEMLATNALVFPEALEIIKEAFPMSR